MCSNTPRAHAQEPESCNVTVYITTYTHGVLALRFSGEERLPADTVGAASGEAVGEADTVPLFVTRGSGWEAVTAWGGAGDDRTHASAVRVHRIKVILNSTTHELIY